MIATTAKLKALLESAEQPCANACVPGCGQCYSCEARRQLATGVPLARLVLTLAEALKEARDSHDVRCTRLDAVEELRL